MKIPEVTLTTGQKPPAGLGVFKPVLAPGQEKPKIRGLGDAIEVAVKPIASVLKLKCLDAEKKLKPDSPCAKRREALNRVMPFS